MNTFTCEKETKVVKGTTIRYIQEHYPKMGFTQYVLKCPKYLSMALVSRYGNKYGADFVTTENGLTKYTASYEKAIILKINTLAPETANVNIDNVHNKIYN